MGSAFYRPQQTQASAPAPAGPQPFPKIGFGGTATPYVPVPLQNSTNWMGQMPAFQNMPQSLQTPQALQTSQQNGLFGQPMASPYFDRMFSQAWGQQSQQPALPSGPPQQMAMPSGGQPQIQDVMRSIYGGGMFGDPSANGMLGGGQPPMPPLLPELPPQLSPNEFFNQGVNSIPPPAPAQAGGFDPRNRMAPPYQMPGMSGNSWDPWDTGG